MSELPDKSKARAIRCLLAYQADDPDAFKYAVDETRCCSACVGQLVVALVDMLVLLLNQTSPGWEDGLTADLLGLLRSR